MLILQFSLMAPSFPPPQDRAYAVSLAVTSLVTRKVQRSTTIVATHMPESMGPWGAVQVPKEGREDGALAIIDRTLEDTQVLITTLHLSLQVHEKSCVQHARFI